MVGCFGDIPIYVFGNFGEAESCGRLCGYNYVNDYVAKGILKSPMYIYNKNGGVFMGCRGGVQSQIVRACRNRQSNLDNFR